MARKFVIALAKDLATLAFPRAELSFSYGWASRARNGTPTGGWGFSRPVWYVGDRDHHSEGEVSPHPSPHRNFTKKKLWREFFSEPSRWWDYRSEEGNPRYPDFKHNKTTHQGLWISDNLTAPWVKAELPTERHVSPDAMSDRNMTREKRWRKFFSDPSQWWDHRSEKVNSRYPDFTHKKTGQSLWLDNKFTPRWVEAELATMPLGLLQSDSFSWNVRLRRHAESQDYQKTLNIFQQMQRQGMMPDKFTFVQVLKACSHLRSLEEGRRVHQQIIQRGCESEIWVANCLVDMYAKCGSIEDAWSVFSRMQKRSVVSWTAMIVGYVKSEQGIKALELFREMQREGVEPDSVTFVALLNACASVAAPEEGRRMHEHIIQRGCQSDVYVATCLVDMYAKCGSIEDAWNVFSKMRERDVVSWSAMLVGYVKSDEGLKALELFRQMQEEGVEPNTVTFVGVLNACASIAALEQGKRVHKEIIRRGWESDVYVANCLIDLYAKCGSIDDAWSVFKRMPKHSVVSWNVLIGGYVKSEQGLKALELFQKMQQDGVEPDAVTFVGALNACASLAALQEGRRVHRKIIRRRCQSDVYVANCLVDMYFKCGSIKDARSVFNKMPEPDVVSWSAMIGGYAMHGLSRKAIQLFKRMGKEGVEINQITVICLLTACSHGRLVDEGVRYFKTMSSHYNLLPTWEHYGSMVNLLGRAGRLEDAEEMAEEMRKKMPWGSDSRVWMTLLGACKIHGNIEIAERAAKRCWELDPENASAYVLLSNIYAAAQKLDRSAATEDRLDRSPGIEEKRLKRNIQKVPLRTWIEVTNVMHSFVVDDNEHPQLLQIHAELETLLLTKNEDGYIPGTRFLSPEETEECHLCCNRKDNPWYPTLYQEKSPGLS